MPLISGYAFQYFQQQSNNTRYREEALQSYYEDISTLLFEKELRTSPADSEARSIARAKTLANLRHLDSNRQGFLVLFLRETDLITLEGIEGEQGIISLSGADLEKANLSEMDLRGVSFWYANLVGAQMQRVNLKKANLKNTNLEGANLEGANLEEANLKRANLEGASLEGAKFCQTTMPDGSIESSDCVKVRK